MKFILNHIKIYLFAALVFTFSTSSEVYGMEQFKLFCSKLIGKIQNTNSLPNTKDAPKESIVAPLTKLINEEPLISVVKIIGMEEREKQLESAENFTVCLDEISEQLEPTPDIQIQESAKNAEPSVTNDKGKEEKEEIKEKDDDKNSKQLSEETALKTLNKQLKTMKKLKQLTENGYDFYQKLVQKHEDELPKKFAELVIFLREKTEQKLNKLRKEFVEEVLKKEGIKAQDIKGNSGRHIVRGIRIGLKSCIALCVGGFIFWATLQSFDALTYSYGVPNFVFNYVGPFTIPKIMSCIAKFPGRFFASFFDLRVQNMEASLKYLGDRCIEKTREIAEKIVELNSNSGAGATLLNPTLNVCAGTYQKLVENLIDPQFNFKEIIGDKSDFFINQFSKILAEENCVNAQRLSEFAFQSTPTTISKQVLLTALEKFKKLSVPTSWISWSSAKPAIVWNTITSGRLSDYLSW